MTAKEITETQPYQPIYGKHSELQVIIQFPAGYEGRLTLAAKENVHYFLTGFDADYEPDAFYVTAHSHPDIMDHEGVLTPQLQYIVDKNLFDVKPLITDKLKWVLDVKNQTDTIQEIEVVFGLQYSKAVRAAEIEKKKTAFEWY